MADPDTIEAAFATLHEYFTAETKRQFLRDIRGQIADSDVVEEIVTTPPGGRIKYIAVTFDRRKNDHHFSYGYFDLILVALDRLAGGAGIYKPSNQMRALRWNSSPKRLLHVLRYFRKNNPQVRFRRALLLPFPVPPVGHAIDATVHMS